jgi:putative endonuclease
MKKPAVYIMANQKNGVLYTGVTSDLVKRVYEHKQSVIDGFTKKYQCKMLVFYEVHVTMEAAITREKQIKGGSRSKKLILINVTNPEWRDLYEEIL